jgi:hypothetical protein
LETRWYLTKAAFDSYIKSWVIVPHQFWKIHS